MATLNGFIRSTSAAIKRADRAQQQRARQAATYYKLQQKAEDINNATETVEQYNNYVDVLRSVHKDCCSTVDWHELAIEQEPAEPIPAHTAETEAMAKLNRYKPSLFDKLFSSSAKKIAKLQSAVTIAKQHDEAAYTQLHTEYKNDLLAFRNMQQIAKAVLAKDPAGYNDALNYFQPFAEINSIGSRIQVEASADYVIVNLHVNNKDVIPNYILTQTSTGKLSKKSIALSKFNELYQDYVCSCSLRTAREALAYLPVKFVIVNAIGELLNSSTGKIEEQTILSVAIFPETLSKLNLDAVDPSDAMQNFVHNTKFFKAAGFVPVEKLASEQFL